MSRGVHKFRQTEVTRAIKAARAAGEEVAGFEIDADGRIRVMFGKKITDHEENEWDSHDASQAKIRSAVS